MQRVNRRIGVAGLCAAALAVGLATGAGADKPAVDPVLVELGAEAFGRYCASCHGVDAKGSGPAALALKPPPADLTGIAARRGGEFPVGEIGRWIDGRFAPAAHGTRDMPVWGERFSERIPEAGVSEEMTRGQIAVLIEYLKSIQEPAKAD